jgi:hypothetical protein
VAIAAIIGGSMSDRAQRLFDPERHEPLAGAPWNEGVVGRGIESIVARTEGAFREDELWPAHPQDLDDGPLPHIASLYLGASGVVWALHELEQLGVAELRRGWGDVAARLPDAYRARPDFPELVDGPVPSLLNGESGILLVAHRLAPTVEQEQQLRAAIEANADNPTRELMWGSPGTMLAAQVMHERTGSDAWLAAWNDSADILWDAWGDELWLQDLYGSPLHVFGPVHGFAGNVLVLARGGALDQGRRRELERRAVRVLARHAIRADGVAQWPPSLEASSQEARTQWCHGAPGIVASCATLAPGDAAFDELLLAGGELTWQAGPLRKGANLCHGTAGNGYALLKLFERTGDELWLERARAFAMHALAQVERGLAEHGRGRHTLWTGDPGTALYLESCLSATASFPTIDRF